LKFTVKKELNCKRIVEVEIPKEDVDNEFNNQLLNYRSKAKIPGFRPGKAPAEIVKSRFSESIKADVLDSLIPKSLEDIFIKENITPIAQPELSSVDFEDGEPLKFRAVVEVRPELDLKNYTGFQIKSQVSDVADSDVDQALKELQERYAEFFPVSRPCHESDLVIVDLVKKHDKLEKVKEDKFDNVEIDLGAEQVLKEFKEGLRGMNIGEMKEIEVNYPADYGNEHLAGNQVRYLTIIKEVKERKLPELDDEFARNFAKLENLNELKKAIRDNLIKKANDEADNAVRGEIISKVVENNRFEVPESLIEKYLKSVTEDFKKRYKDVDDFQLRQSYRPVAENTIRWQFIYREIADKNNIKVSETDRAEWIKGFARQYNMPEEKARASLGRAGKFDDLDDSLLEKKVLDFVKENSKITQ
jgi:trigger factor